MVLASRFSPNRGHQRAITGGRSEAALDDAKWKKICGASFANGLHRKRTLYGHKSQKSQDVSGIKSNAMNCLANWRARRDSNS